ncbi:MAG: class I SAM-dependent methyltransferase [Terriglobales bacterium]
MPEEPQAASFRDPAGRLFLVDGRVLRLVHASARAGLEEFLVSTPARELVTRGLLISSRVLDDGQRSALAQDAAALELMAPVPDAALVEHERIEFPSYPYEWPPEMLHAAATLTLDLALELLEHGWGLKDATPYNVLFRGADPVFVDVLSIERRDAANPTWLPYAQFVRTFLLPLLAAQRFGLPLDHIFLGRRDGLESEDLYRMCGPLQRFLPPVFSLVSMPTWLGTRANPDDASLYRQELLPDAEKARYILRSLLNRLRRQLKRLTPKPGRSSAWSDYLSTSNYSHEHFAAKHSFVEQALNEHRPARVLDVGANTGYFSRLAAQSGARVVAIDYDPVVVGDVWRAARADRLTILPLVVNLARPSPATGWRNRECPAFLDRAREAFDAVLMLAVVHHMLVTERVPLEEIVDVAAELTRDLLIVEYVDPADSMFRRLLRGREELHRDFNPQRFEQAFRRRFQIVRSARLPEATRTLYLMRKGQGL